MQIIIKNRLNSAKDKYIEDVNVKIPELITALWEVPQRKIHRLFSKTSKPTPDHVQQVMNHGILSCQKIHFTPYYGKPISGVTLVSNNVYWVSLVINEKEYFNFRAKKVGLVDQLVDTYSTPCKPSVSLSLPEPRPSDEINPVYPDKPSVKTEPKKEISASLDKAKTDSRNLVIHAALGLVVTAVCMALGISWPFSLVVVILSNFAVFYAQNRVKTQNTTPELQKTTHPETPKPSSDDKSPDRPSPELPIPDNISVLFSQQNLNSPKEPARPVLEASSIPTKKVAKI